MIVLYPQLIKLKPHGEQNRSHYPGRASALDFKDVAAARFGQSDVVFVYQKVPPVNHQQKCLTNGICGTVLIKSQIILVQWYLKC